MQFSGPTPNLLNEKLQGWGPSTLHLNKPSSRILLFKSGFSLSQVSIFSSCDSWIVRCWDILSSQEAPGSPVSLDWVLAWPRQRNECPGFWVMFICPGCPLGSYLHLKLQLICCLFLKASVTPWSDLTDYIYVHKARVQVALTICVKISLPICAWARLRQPWV